MARIRHADLSTQMMAPVWPGDRVEITGLNTETSAASRLNGTLATVQSFNQDAERFVVISDVDDKQYSLRPGNLKRPL
eukprot:4705804-Prymnesium_polylepis.1